MKGQREPTTTPSEQGEGIVQGRLSEDGCMEGDKENMVQGDIRLPKMTESQPASQRGEPPTSR